MAVTAAPGVARLRSSVSTARANISGTAVLASLAASSSAMAARTLLRATGSSAGQTAVQLAISMDLLVCWSRTV